MISSHSMVRPGHFKLGLFSPNCSGGMAITSVDERWQATWENNLELAILADNLGLEFLLPIARWAGYGGKTDFQGDSLETITWATGLLSKTNRINVFATAHSAFFHPLVAAKQFATMTQIGKGRFGLNVVCGWNKPEYDMFGIQLSDSHDERYKYGKSWFSLIKKAWKEKVPFSWDDKYFKVQDAVCSPGLYGDTLPPVMSAGSSPQGQKFAAENCDFLFTVLLDLESGKQIVKNVKDIGRCVYNRNIDLFTTTYVVCRRTMKEARDYHHYYASENADSEAVDRLMSLMGMHAHSFPRDQIDSLKLHFAAGHGVYPLVGDPDFICGEIEKIAASGFSGASLAFVDYLAELPFFGDEVLPRLVAKGIRLKT